MNWRPRGRSGSTSVTPSRHRAGCRGTVSADEHDIGLAAAPRHLASEDVEVVLEASAEADDGALQGPIVAHVDVAIGGIDGALDSGVVGHVDGRCGATASASGAHESEPVYERAAELGIVLDVDSACGDDRDIRACDVVLDCHVAFDVVEA